MKTYYALYDHFVSPGNPGQGFANTKSIACFTSHRDRKDFINSRDWDYSCRPITRQTAIKLSVPESCPELGYDTRGYYANYATPEGEVLDYTRKLIKATSTNY